MSDGTREELEFTIAENDKLIKTLGQDIARLEQYIKLHYVSAETLHDRYTMAALTGLCANPNGIITKWSAGNMIVAARQLADVAMRQRVQNREGA